ncbi:MAG TPA: MFS transporter [Oculatellaceae cyanobacterium]
MAITKESAKLRIPAYILALKEPQLAALWTSQVLSAVGDQLYMLAAMWIAVHRFGAQAGYVAAAIGIGRISFGLIGGVIADRQSHKHILIVSDIMRFFAVLPLPLIASGGTIELWHLVVAGAIIGAGEAFFDPALQSSLPTITSSQAQLEAMTGLLDLTQRLARAIVPGLTGLLIAIMQITQFFTIDAISFLISVLTILSLGSKLSWHCPTNERSHAQAWQGMLPELIDGFRAVGKHRALRYALCNTLIQSVLWGTIFTVGIPTLVKHAFQDKVANYGLLVAAWGTGSVIGNVLCANLRVKSTWFNAFVGVAVWGLGFVMLGLCRNIETAAASAIFGAIGSAFGDLLMIRLIMKEVPANMLGRIISLRGLVMSGGNALGLLFAATLFELASPFTIIASSGAITFLLSSVGAIKYARYVFGTARASPLDPGSSCA